MRHSIFKFFLYLFYMFLVYSVVVFVVSRLTGATKTVILSEEAKRNIFVQEIKSNFVIALKFYKKKMSKHNFNKVLNMLYIKI